MPRTYDAKDEAELLALAKRNYGTNFAERNMAKEQVVFSEYGSESWSLYEFMDQLNLAIEKIPAEYRSSARVEFELDRGYDGDCDAELRVVFTAPEPEKEWRARIAAAWDYAIDKLERLRSEELSELARLRHKYGSKG